MKYPQRHLIKSMDIYTQLLWHLPQLYNKNGSHLWMWIVPNIFAGPSQIRALLPNKRPAQDVLAISTPQLHQKLSNLVFSGFSTWETSKNQETWELDSNWRLMSHFLETLQICAAWKPWKPKVTNNYLLTTTNSIDQFTYPSIPQ